MSEEVAYHEAKAIVKGAVNAAGVLTQTAVALRDNKKGRYTKDYKSNIAAANTEAVASAASYIYSIPSNANAHLAQGYIDKHAPGYTLDRSLSDNEHIVLRNDATKQAMVAYRGTDVGTPDDIFADVDLAFAGTDYSHIDRFKVALDRFERAKRELSGYSFTVTGHSLGGSQAMWVARHNPSVKARVFNPGITSHNGSQTLGTGIGNALGNMFHMRDKNQGKEYNNIEIVRMDGDIVSSGYTSRVGFEATMADGEKVEKHGHWIRPYGHNGATLVNAKYDDPDTHGLNWTAKAHSLSNFMTKEQAIEFRDLAKISKDMWVYGEDDEHSAAAKDHARPAGAKSESHAQMVDRHRTGNAYHAHVHTASLDI